MLGFIAAVESADVSFGPYNSIQCRPEQLISYSANMNIPQNGLVIAMDIYLYSSGSANQTILSIFNKVSGFLSVRVRYLSGKLNVWMNSTSSHGYYVLNSSMNVQVAPGNQMEIFSE